MQWAKVRVGRLPSGGRLHDDALGHGRWLGNRDQFTCRDHLCTDLLARVRAHADSDLDRHPWNRLDLRGLERSVVPWHSSLHSGDDFGYERHSHVHSIGSTPPIGWMVERAVNASAGHVEDGVRARTRPTKVIDRLNCAHHDQIHPSALGFGDYIFGDRQRSGGAATDHETST